MIKNNANHTLIIGDLESLKNTHQEIIKNGDIEKIWNKYIYHGIQSDISLECVKYAFINGCLFYNGFVKEMALKNCLEILKFAVKNGAKYNNDIVESRVTNIYDVKYTKFVENLDKNIFNCALLTAKHMKIKKLDIEAFKMLRFFHRNCSDIVHIEHKKVLVPTWNEETLNLAAKFGYLECVKYLLRYRCKFSKNAYVFAVSNDHIDVLEYLHKLSKAKVLPKWDGNYVIHTAATSGSIECLKYCFKNGCQVTNDLCSNALQSYSFECFKFLYQQGCTTNKKELISAIQKFKDPHIKAYLIECYKRTNNFNYLSQIRCTIS